MQQTKFQRMLFAFITVIITVHAYVFYSLYVINGNAIVQSAIQFAGAPQTVGKLAATRLLQLSVRLLYATVFHTAAREKDI